MTLTMPSPRAIWPVMSRLARHPSGPDRTWAPPESPLRIEFSSALLREVRMAGTMVDAFGVLYGTRNGETIHLASTRGRAGLEPIGVFASRVRGEIFLTEQDLERFEKNEAAVALVIAGEKAGFFVRETSGAMETVRSYEEFSIYGGPVATAPAPAVRKRRFAWAYALALVPLLFFIPRHPAPPLNLALNEDEGQLHISWNQPKKETLTILDGGEQTTIAVDRSQKAVTYARRTGDVLVKLGPVQARFLGPPRPANAIEQMRASINQLHSQVIELRASHNAGVLRIAELNRRLQ